MLRASDYSTALTRIIKREIARRKKDGGRYRCRLRNLYMFRPVVTPNSLTARESPKRLPGGHCFSFGRPIGIAKGGQPSCWKIGLRAWAAVRSRICGNHESAKKVSGENGNLGLIQIVGNLFAALAIGVNWKCHQHCAVDQFNRIEAISHSSNGQRDLPCRR
jgi:hypothetical protein